MKGIAWIVGASSGIGAALAHELAAQGWRVVASARSRDALERVAETAGEMVWALPVDVTDASALGDAAERIEARWGPITHCFLNAAAYEPMPLDAFSIERFRTAVEVNLMGVVNGLAAILPRMRTRRAGQVLITASAAGYRGLPRAAPYNASKAALINMAESLRPELELEGVCVRVINPGFVETPLTAKNTFPMPAMITPQQAARAIARRLDDTGFEIAFPRAFIWVMKLLRRLPYRLYFALTRRMVQA